jgi:hypothetical protein
MITSIKAQNEYQLEDEFEIYWQPNAQIDFSDYQSTNQEECIKCFEKYGFSMAANIVLRGVVDIPVKKRSKKFDKVYLAPAFCKNCSCLLSEDSLNLEVDRLMFDMAEVCARHARKELLEMHNLMKADNSNAMFYTTVKNKWDAEMTAYFVSVLTDVLIEKKDSAFIKWRNSVDEILLLSQEYATQPEDCHRLATNKPIEEGYKMAKTIMGDLRTKEEE